ncbi:MAG TPA: serine/threonine-protein kinase, partial [Pyrinomonadaceae bacterium]
MDTAAHKTIGPYTLKRLLKTGVTGSLWLAETYTVTFMRSVVVKVVADGLKSRDAIMRRAKAWAQASAEPNIIPLIETGIYGGQLVIATDYFRDGSLEDRLNERDGLPLGQQTAIAVMLDILAGLKAAHYRKILYRDLDPSRVLFSGRTARLLWPSLAHVMRLEADDSQPGSSFPRTIPYFSPEALGGGYTERADVWSAGVIFYRMLSGRLPFPLKSLSECVSAIVSNNPPPAITLPEWLWEIVFKALEKEPRKRFESAEEMRAVLLAKWSVFAPTNPRAGAKRAGPITLTGPFSSQPVNTGFDASAQPEHR